MYVNDIFLFKSPEHLKLMSTYYLLYKMKKTTECPFLT